MNFEFLFLLSGHAVSFIYGSRFKVSVFFRTEPCTCCPLLKEWLVVSTTNIRIHGPASSSFVEERMVDTPNLRFLSIADFEEFCVDFGVTVHRRIALDTEGGVDVSDSADPNLTADLAIFVISR